MIAGTDPIGGIKGIAAAIGGNTPDIDDDVNAAIALAAAAARLRNENDTKLKTQFETKYSFIEFSTHLLIFCNFLFNIF